MTLTGPSSGGRRVLVVSHEASRTGAPRVALDLVDALGSAGWDTVAVLRWGGPLEPEFERCAGRVVREPFGRLRAVLLRWGWSRRVVVPRIERIAASLVLRRERPGLVWANTVISSVYAVAASRSGVPAIVLSHEHPEVVERLVDRSGLGALLAEGRSPLPVLLGCAAGPAGVLESAVGPAAGPVGVIHSPVDVDAVRSAAGHSGSFDRPGGVLAVGLASETKGADVFAAAADLAHERGMRVPWLWVGEQVADVGSTRAEFVGPRSNSAAEIAAADVLVLPSRADSFPLVVLEAMALGTPVVAVDLPGPREQLGDHGLLVPVGDAAAIVDAVAEVLSDPVASATRASRAQDRCERLWDISRFRREVARISSEVARSGRSDGTG